ncbi:MAG: SLC13 family permease [Desulfobacterales bacterium]|nr:SLC13 family permease [Desulfobacterales bacterium]
MAIKPFINFRLIFFVLAIALGLGLLLFSPASLSTEESKTAALVIIIISSWATGIFHEHLTSLFFFFFAMLFSIAPAQVIFSGFGTTVFWLVFGGLVIGIGITDTGLGNRIAGKVVAYLDGSYFRLISGLVVMGILFAFLMPSPIGRVLLLIPIALKISSYFGFKKGSNGQTGVILSVIVGTVVPAFAILPSNGVNMILAGLSETQFHISILYGDYLFLNFPIFGILKALVIVFLILMLYPDKPKKNRTEELIAAGPISSKETVLFVIIILLLALWMTDFIHKVSPAWISLGGAILLLIPGIQIVGTHEFNKKINFGSLFYLAGVLGVGGLVSHSGLGNVLANKLIASLPFGVDKPFLNYVLLSLVSSFTGMIATLPGVPAVMTPIADSLSQVTGLPLKTVLMTQVLGFSTIFFPYQIPSVVVGLQIAGEKLSVSAKLFLALAVITYVFLLPINYFWWKLVGGI